LSAFPYGVSASARESFASSAAAVTVESAFHAARRATPASATTWVVIATRSGSFVERESASYAPRSPPSPLSTLEGAAARRPALFAGAGGAAGSRSLFGGAGGEELEDAFASAGASLSAGAAAF